MKRYELITTSRFLVEKEEGKNYNGSFLHYYRNVVKPDFQVTTKEFRLIKSCVQNLILKAILQGRFIDIIYFGKFSLIPRKDKISFDRTHVFFLSRLRYIKRFYKVVWLLDFKLSFYKSLGEGKVNKYEILRNQELLKTGHLAEYLKHKNDLSNITL